MLNNPNPTEVLEFSKLCKKFLVYKMYGDLGRCEWRGDLLTSQIFPGLKLLGAFKKLELLPFEMSRVTRILG